MNIETYVGDGREFIHRTRGMSAEALQALDRSGTGAIRITFPTKARAVSFQTTFHQVLRRIKRRKDIQLVRDQATVFIRRKDFVSPTEVA